MALCSLFLLICYYNESTHSLSSHVFLLSFRLVFRCLGPSTLKFILLNLQLLTGVAHGKSDQSHLYVCEFVCPRQLPVRIANLFLGKCQTDELLLPVSSQKAKPINTKYKAAWSGSALSWYRSNSLMLFTFCSILSTFYNSFPSQSF